MIDLNTFIDQFSSFDKTKFLDFKNSNLSSNLNLAISKNWTKIYAETDLTSDKRSYSINYNPDINLYRNFSIYKDKFPDIFKIQSNRSFGPVSINSIDYDFNIRYLAPIWLHPNNIPDFVIIFKKEDGWNEKNAPEMEQSEISFVYDFRDKPLFQSIVTELKWRQPYIKDTTIENNFEFFGHTLLTGRASSFFKFIDTWNHIVNKDILNLWLENDFMIPGLLNLEFFFHDDVSDLSKYHLEYFKIDSEEKTLLNLHDLSSRFNVQIPNYFAQSDELNITNINENNQFITLIDDYEFTEIAPQATISTIKDKTNFLTILNPDPYAGGNSFSKVFGIKDHINLNDFLGAEPKGDIQIDAEQIEKTVSSLKIQIEDQIKTRNIFSNGDYMYIRTNSLHNLEFRVYFTNTSCFVKNKKYTQLSKSKTTQFYCETTTPNAHNSIKFNLFEEDEVFLEENREIKIEYSDKIIITKIFNFRKDLDGTISFRIFDEHLRTWILEGGTADGIKFTYQTPNIYYIKMSSELNAEKTVKEISHSLEAFRKWNLFSSFYSKNNLILYSLSEKGGFENFHVGFNLKPKTETKNLNFNDVPFSPIYYSDIFKYNIDEHPMVGSLNDKKGILIDFIDIQNFDFSDYYIPTYNNFGSQIYKYNNNFYYTNYIKDRKYYENKRVIVLENDDTPIIKNGKINIKKKFVPTILKMTKMDIA